MVHAEKGETMNNHTPGPWIFEVWDYAKAIPARKELVIRTACLRVAVLDWDQRQDNPYTIPNDEAFANARLITAAPDMYKVLAAVLSWMEDLHDINPFFTNLRENARAALAAAEEREGKP